jgi:radical SAM protein with 4Fe4S-binding SPASM domain
MTSIENLKKSVGDEKALRRFDSGKILNRANLPRVAEWVRGENTPPIVVEIDPTNRCAGKCPWCAGGRGESKEEKRADLPNLGDIIDQLVDFGCKAAIFTGGGEPLLNKETTSAIVKAKKSGLEVGLITSALVPISEEDAIDLVNHCDFIRVSLDASSPEEYQYSHGLGKNALDLVINNIILLGRTKIENQISDSRCSLGVGFLTNKETLPGMYPTTLLCSQIQGVDFIQFRPYHYDLTPIDKQLEDCRSLERSDFHILSSAQKYERMKEKTPHHLYKMCYAQQFATVISATGEIFICCHMRGNMSYSIGNIKHSSLEQIWDSERRQEILKSVPEQCYADCIPFCRGDDINRTIEGVMQENKHAHFL